MARDFAKSTSTDFLSYSTLGRISEFLNGAAKASVGIWVKADSLTNTSTSDGVVFRIFIQTGAAGSASGIVINTSNGTSNIVRCLSKSQTSDSVQTVDSVSTLTTGVWVHLGVVCDYAGDNVKIYIDGVEDVSTGVTYGASVYTDADNQSNTDGLTSNGSNPNHHWDGQMAEWGVWTDDIGASGFAALAKGVSPLLVLPQALVVYNPLNRQLVDLMMGDVLAVTGSVPYADHPRVFYPARKKFARGATAAPAASRSRLSLIGVGV